MARARKATEADWTTFVLDLARFCRWRSFHVRPARSDKGWRTPVQGDGVGFPDLVLVRAPRLIFAELKSETGRLRPEQLGWLAELKEVRDGTLEQIGRVTPDRSLVLPMIPEVYVWRPSDVDRIREILR